MSGDDVCSDATGRRREPFRVSIRAAAVDVAAVGPSMAVLGLSFGFLVASSGLSWWWTPVFSGLIYAGSLEFLLIPLAAAGTSLIAIAITTFLVNSRHIFYGLTFPLEKVKGSVARVYAIFALIDEAYALLATRNEDFDSTRIIATQILLQSSWVGGGLVGALGGALIASPIRAFDFVFIGLFLVLAIEAVISGKTVVAPAIGVVSAIIARFTFPGELLIAAMSLMTVLLLANYFVRQGRSNDV